MGARCSSRPGVTSFSLIAQPVRLYLRQPRSVVFQNITKATSLPQQSGGFVADTAENQYLT